MISGWCGSWPYLECWFRFSVNANIPHWWQCPTLEFKVEIFIQYRSKTTPENIFSRAIQMRAVHINKHSPSWSRPRSFLFFKGPTGPNAGRLKYNNSFIASHIKWWFIIGNKRSTSNSTYSDVGISPQRGIISAEYIRIHERNSSCTIPFTGKYNAS